MNRNQIGWFEIYVAEINRAKLFYESVFQVKLEKREESDSNLEVWAFPSSFEAGGASGAICKMKGFEPGHNSVLVYFTCADCNIEEKKVKKYGGKIQKTKESIGQYGFTSLVHDTEGNIIGLHSMK